MPNQSTPPSYPSEPTRVLPPDPGGGAPPNQSIPPSYPSTPPTSGGAPATLPGVPAVNRMQFIKNYAAW
jgi:hypothetical protein